MKESAFSTAPVASSVSSAPISVDAFWGGMIVTMLGWLLILIMLLSVIRFFISLILIGVSGGDENATGKGKDSLWTAVVRMAVCLAAFIVLHYAASVFDLRIAM